MRRGGVRHRCLPCLAKAKEYVHPTPNAEKMAFLNPELQVKQEQVEALKQNRSQSLPGPAGLLPLNLVMKSSLCRIIFC